jgi:hypothetical protein
MITPTPKMKKSSHKSILLPLAFSVITVLGSTNVNAWGFVSTATQKSNALIKYTASKCTDNALLYLCAINPCEWKQVPTHVVKHLNRVAVQRIYFVSQLK